MKKIISIILTLVLILGGAVTSVGAADKKAPVLKSINPSNKSTKVKMNVTIKANFNENIYKGKYFSKISLKLGNTSVKTTVKIINKKTISIDPKSDLKEAMTYIISIPANSIKDAKGNYIKKSLTYIFTTGNKSDGNESTENAIALSSEQLMCTFGKLNYKSDCDYYKIHIDQNCNITFAATFFKTSYAPNLKFNLLYGNGGFVQESKLESPGTPNVRNVIHCELLLAGDYYIEVIAKSSWTPDIGKEEYQVYWYYNSQLQMDLLPHSNIPMTQDFIFDEYTISEGNTLIGYTYDVFDYQKYKLCLINAGYTCIGSEEMGGKMVSYYSTPVDEAFGIYEEDGKYILFSSYVE